MVLQILMKSSKVFMNKHVTNQSTLYHFNPVTEQSLVFKKLQVDSIRSDEVIVPENIFPAGRDPLISNNCHRQAAWGCHICMRSGLPGEKVPPALYPDSFPSLFPKA